MFLYFKFRDIYHDIFLNCFSYCYICVTCSYYCEKLYFFRFFLSLSLSLFLRNVERLLFEYEIVLFDLIYKKTNKTRLIKLVLCVKLTYALY